LEVLDASGHVIRHWSSTDQPRHANPKLMDIPASWIPVQYPPSAAPGSHRFVWNLQNGDRIYAPPGRYTVRMMVGGKTYSQPLELRRDPTYPATDADLRAQFQLAQAVDAQAKTVAAALSRAKALLPKHRALAAIVGHAPPTTPDDSVGKPAQDFSSLRYIGDALQGLLMGIESADARPTPDQYSAFAILKTKAARAIRSLPH
jgi:hypothetical protein